MLICINDLLLHRGLWDLFFFNLFIFSWRIIALQYSAGFRQYQHESTTGIRMTPASRTSLPPPSPSHPSRLLQSPIEFPESYSKFPLVIYFTHGNVCFFITQYISPSPSSPATMSISETCFLWDLSSPTRDPLNLCPLQWKGRVLTTGPPRTSKACCFHWAFSEAVVCQWAQIHSIFCKAVQHSIA